MGLEQQEIQGGKPENSPVPAPGSQKQCYHVPESIQTGSMVSTGPFVGCSQLWPQQMPMREKITLLNNLVLLWLPLQLVKSSCAWLEPSSWWPAPVSGSTGSWAKGWAHMARTFWRKGWAQLRLGFVPKGSVGLGKVAGGGVALRDVFDPGWWSYTDFPGEMAAASPGKLLVGDDNELCGWWDQSLKGSCFAFRFCSWLVGSQGFSVCGAVGWGSVLPANPPELLPLAPAFHSLSSTSSGGVSKLLWEGLITQVLHFLWAMKSPGWQLQSKAFLCCLSFHKGVGIAGWLWSILDLSGGSRGGEKHFLEDKRTSVLIAFNPWTGLGEKKGMEGEVLPLIPKIGLFFPGKQRNCAHRVNQGFSISRKPTGNLASFTLPRTLNPRILILFLFINVALT